MTGIDKTATLERIDVPIDHLIPNENNPNVMTGRAFDLLVDNIEKTGLTDPILVRRLGDGKYRVVGGHHRLDAAKYLGFESVPCTVITDPEFDDDAEAFQLVRMNVIRGKMDPAAFFGLYEKVKQKYADEVLQEMFGFAEEAEFQRLVQQAAKQLPKELQAKFKEAAKEIKTIDGLSRLLNQMFAQYGNTLPFGFMVIDYGGKDSIWLQVTSPTFKSAVELGFRCIEQKRSLDDVLGLLLKRFASSEFEGLLAEVMKEAPEIVIPPDYSGVPSKQALAEHTHMQAAM